MMRPLCIFLMLFSKICKYFTTFFSVSPFIDFILSRTCSGFLKFKQHFTCSYAGQVPAGVTQDSGAITAEVGEDVTLKCSCQTGAITFLSWYQQRLGGKPTFISNQMKYSGEATVSSAFKGRFEVSGDPQDASSSCLKISSVLPSDSAMYYCGFMEFNTIEFGEGVFLHVKNQSKVQAIVHQQESQSLHLGDSVNLSCTVSSENCGSGTSIYWFRPGRAQAVITAQECSSQVKKQTSVFTITSANHLDAGMYYCVVASGGEIMFGNGTRVEITGRSSPAKLVFSNLRFKL